MWRFQLPEYLTTRPPALSYQEKKNLFKDSHLLVAMDIFSHTLWAIALFLFLNQHFKKKFKIRWAALWGAFPDLVIPISFLLFVLIGMVFFGVHPAEVPKEHSDVITSPAYVSLIHPLTQVAYLASHSLVFFLIVFYTRERETL